MSIARRTAIWVVVGAAFILVAILIDPMVKVAYGTASPKAVNLGLTSVFCLFFLLVAMRIGLVAALSVCGCGGVLLLALGVFFSTMLFDKDINQLMFLAVYPESRAQLLITAGYGALLAAAARVVWTWMSKGGGFMFGGSVGNEMTSAREDLDTLSAMGRLFLRADLIILGVLLLFVLLLGWWASS